MTEWFEAKIITVLIYYSTFVRTNYIMLYYGQKDIIQWSAVPFSETKSFIHVHVGKKFLDYCLWLIVIMVWGEKKIAVTG